jgi:hypothetical protein
MIFTSPNTILGLIAEVENRRAVELLSKLLLLV